MMEQENEKVLARELTGWELMHRIRQGHDIALLPVGSMEMHGGQLPLGVDSYVAEAVCRFAAAKMKGTVFDTISYTWPGCTKYSFPTISMTMEMETNYTRMACEQLARIGMRRIYVVQCHGKGIPLTKLAREFFEETGVPLVFYGLMRMPNDGRKECEAAGVAWEPSLAAAAAKMLGYQATFNPSAWPKERPIEPLPAQAAMTKLWQSGAVTGHLGTHDSQHGTFFDKLDAKLGLACLHKLADTIASTADAMAEWRDVWKGKDIESSWPSMVDE